mgnify:CR=1 FL=1
MTEKRVIPCIYVSNGIAVKGISNKETVSENVDDLAVYYCDHGADAILFFDLSDTDFDHEMSISILKSICSKIQIPVCAGGNIARQEDVKKILYAGARKAILNYSKPNADDLLKEVSERFGKERIGVSLNDFDSLFKHQESIEEWSSESIFMHRPDFNSVSMISKISSIIVTDIMDKETIFSILKESSVNGISGAYISQMGIDYNQFKQECIDRGIPMQVLVSTMPFSEFVTDANGLIPVVTQDCKTGEVLMLAYMNEASFQRTLETGRMVYFSRSRQKLWMKGETSGHFQYVKSMTVDCDKDTLLAKVAQVGPACHTGNPTCFFTQLFGIDYDEKNPLLVLEAVMDTIKDRKLHPKEGSYTNYLFEKGIDKILKKVGEESSEIIIAAKNPDPEEVKYEISDLLYHIMVLMVERGVSWDDITEELSRR